MTCSLNWNSQNGLFDAFATKRPLVLPYGPFTAIATITPTCLDCVSAFVRKQGQWEQWEWEQKVIKKTVIKKKVQNKAQTKS